MAESEGKEETSPLLKKAEEELKEYFSSRRKTFDVPYALNVSPFEAEVLKQIEAIPYGQKRTYGEIAQKIGEKKAARAVGHACHLNPLPFFIPCHRVVGAGNRLGGYGLGEKNKEYLLSLESACQLL